MARAATSRLKFNPPLGRMPAPQFCRPAELRIDPAYQRSIETGPSKTLIQRIAQHWNWDLCQPLVVSRREGRHGLFVIDGQHRLEAAKLRGDIDQLPCVVVEYATAADEAASFVHLNQQRRPLGKLDVFKAAVASEDPEAVAIAAAIEAAGLAIAPHSNYTAWKPGMVSNIGGIEACWRSRGAEATRLALDVTGEALGDQVLRYAGSVFPGIAAIVADEWSRGRIEDPMIRECMVEMIREVDQVAWRAEIMRARGEDPNLKFAAASAKVFRAAWAELRAELLDEAA